MTGAGEDLRELAPPEEARFEEYRQGQVQKLVSPYLGQHQVSDGTCRVCCLTAMLTTECLGRPMAVIDQLLVGQGLLDWQNGGWAPGPRSAELRDAIERQGGVVRPDR